MLNSVLANFYERDIRKLIDEVNSFRNEEDLWRTQGDVKNSAGNLVLHIIGGTSYLIGTQLAQTGYVRHRDQELFANFFPLHTKTLVIKLAEDSTVEWRKIHE